MSTPDNDFLNHTFVVLVDEQYAILNLAGRVENRLSVSEAGGAAERRLLDLGKRAVFGSTKEDRHVFVYAACVIDKIASGRPGTKYIHLIECEDRQSADLQSALCEVYRHENGLLAFVSELYAVAMSVDRIRARLVDIATAVNRSTMTMRHESTSVLHAKGDSSDQKNGPGADGEAPHNIGGQKRSADGGKAPDREDNQRTTSAIGDARATTLTTTDPHGISGVDRDRPQAAPSLDANRSRLPVLMFTFLAGGILGSLVTWWIAVRPIQDTLIELQSDLLRMQSDLESLRSEVRKTEHK
jgi:hypothetical protein